MAASSGSDGGHYDDEFGDYASRRKKPCRTCTDFKTWAKSKGSTLTKIPDEGRGCPLDRKSLGRCSWSFLHTLAAHYPKRPTAEQRTDVEAFFRLFAKFYPCRDCADDFRNSLEASPPQTSSRTELAQWLCAQHNLVNAKLGKPIFDCSRVDERWRRGWDDGSCG
ncbi:unnamed protein product [Ixodes persulcatus]